jgi:Type II secretory pathway, component PulF
MATFKYLAFNGQEKKISGYINATDQVEAISMLQSKGLNPLSVTQSEQKKSKIKISKRDLSIFTKQMSALLSAGTPLEKSLELLSLQTTQ